MHKTQKNLSSGMRVSSKYVHPHAACARSNVSIEHERSDDLIRSMLRSIAAPFVPCPRLFPCTVLLFNRDDARFLLNAVIEMMLDCLTLLSFVCYFDMMEFQKNQHSIQTTVFYSSSQNI